MKAAAVHCEDRKFAGRALCGAPRPVFARSQHAITCKRCLSWPNLIAESFGPEALKGQAKLAVIMANGPMARARAVATLRDRFHLSFPELGQLLGCAPSTVRRSYEKARPRC
jgi:hypothetical protein